MHTQGVRRAVVSVVDGGLARQSRRRAGRSANAGVDETRTKQSAIAAADAAAAPAAAAAIAVLAVTVSVVASAN